MLKIETSGMVYNSKIEKRRFPVIEKGEMKFVSGIIVHQTGASTAQSTFNSYSQHFANGAHFLIDKDGKIYQTASIYRQTWHVGKLKARCLLENKCSPAEKVALAKFNPSAEHQREIKKSVPHRFPSNQDSIGIEMVGETTSGGGYVDITAQQNSSLLWLVQELKEALSLRASEIFRHPTVSRKNPTEASSAKW